MDLEKNKHLGSKPKAFDKFLEEAHIVHGDRYSYDNFVYKNNKTKGLIHCNKCGNDFWMIPTNHICKHQGCPKCNGTHKKKTEEWVEECKKKYDYDYSQSEYVNASIKIKIICHHKDEFGNEHGEFWKTPRKHLVEGQGCPKCSKVSVVTFEDFVCRARNIHGDRYTYHKEDYTNYTSKTRITCKEHGDFYQIPQAHVLGNGCPNCWNGNRNKTRIIPFSEFVERARKIYGDKYIYNEDKYVNYTTKTVATCPIHGDFEVIPYKHIERKRECRECKKEELSEKFLLPFDEVIKRSKEVHGDKYDYSKSVYKGNMISMEIICPKHGSFWQKPIKHWIGQGCPKCNQSHLERDIELLLNENKVEFIYQATKKDLNFLNMMSLDFYIPKYKLAIECQGIQHFEDNGMFKSKKVIERDKLKHKLCEENGIKLVYYTNLEEKIQTNDFYKDKTFFIDKNNFFKNNFKL